MTDQPLPRFARSRARYSPWAVLALVVAAIILMPIVSVVSRVFVPAEDVWPQLIDTVLPLYIRNSVLMVLGVVSLAALIGVATGWLVAAYDFPGRRVFEWALMLPLAMPGYVIAYVYYDRLSYWGPFQSACATCSDGRGRATGSRTSPLSPGPSSCWRWCCTRMSTCWRARPSSASRNT